MKHVCEICGHVHDDEKGERWEDLPADWVCPECGASKADFTATACASS